MAKRKKEENVDVRNNKTAEKISKLEEKRAELIEKRTVINNAIKDVDKELSACYQQWNQEKVETIMGILKEKKLNIDNLLDAVSRLNEGKTDNALYETILEEVQSVGETVEATESEANGESEVTETITDESAESNEESNEESFEEDMQNLENNIQESMHFSTPTF